MAYLAPVFLIIIAYMAGSLFQFIIKDKNSRVADTVLIGTMLLLLAFEAVILPSIKLLASFGIVCKVYSAVLLAVLVCSILFARKQMLGQLKVRKLHEIWPFIGALGIMVLQAVFLFFLAPDVSNDFTVETVNTTLVSDLIYENHPGMGETFQYGITFRGKLVTLPLFYAWLLNLFGGEAVIMVYRAVPLWLLLLNAAAYWSLGSNVYDHDEISWKHGYIFAMGIGLLNIFGSFARDCLFYYQMYRGFRGETFVFGILLPLSVCLCNRIFACRKYKLLLYLAMLLLTAVCVTDYQKGVVPVAVSVCLCLLLFAVQRLRRWIRCRQ